MKQIKIVSMPDAPNVRVVETADVIYINRDAKGWCLGGQESNA